MCWSVRKASHGGQARGLVAVRWLELRKLQGSAQQGRSSF